MKKIKEAFRNDVWFQSIVRDLKEFKNLRVGYRKISVPVLYFAKS